MIINFVIGSLKEYAQDPSSAKQCRDNRLGNKCLVSMEAWDKHLEEYLKRKPEPKLIREWL